MFGLPIAMRSIVDHLRFPERQRVTPEVLGFDTTSFPVELALPATRRSPTGITVLTVHVSDVDGGFGVSKQAVSRWRRLLEQGKVPAELYRQLPNAHDLGGSSFLLALLERYSRIAYHRVASRRAGDVRNHPLALRTSHGNTGNLGAGWALDCGHDEELTEGLIAIGRSSLSSAIDDVVASGGRCIVVPHRVWSAGRRRDTDERTWRNVVKPTIVARAAGGVPVVIGYETVAADGLPIPRSWDDDAKFDDRGRALAA